jgi:protein involved in polysaccharide export with SLBB domain
MHLLDALAQSDGLDSEAGFEIVVLQPATNTSDEQETHIPIQPLLDGSDPRLNIPLRGGEQIRVPRAGKLYIVGNVKNPGAFPVTDSEGLSVLKAVGLCQGLLPYSSDRAIIYRLVSGTPQRTQIEVPVKDILRHRASDVPLQANDILYISDRAGKRLTATTLQRITGVGNAAATVLMWRTIP